MRFRRISLLILSPALVLAAGCRDLPVSWTGSAGLFAGKATAPGANYWGIFDGGIISNPVSNPAPPPPFLPGPEQFLGKDVTSTWPLDPLIRYDSDSAGYAHTAFVASKAFALANLAACVKSTNKLSSAQVSALIEQMVSADPGTHGMKVSIDDPSASSTSGWIRTHWLISNHPVLGTSELHVGARESGISGPVLLVTRESVSTLPDGREETVYRYHAGTGHVNVWWRDGPWGGPAINCPLRDDVLVALRKQAN